jgi:hypothetical protein
MARGDVAPAACCSAMVGARFRCAGIGALLSGVESRLAHRFSDCRTPCSRPASVERSTFNRHDRDRYTQFNQTATPVDGRGPGGMESV